MIRHSEQAMTSHPAPHLWGSLLTSSTFSQCSTESHMTQKMDGTLSVFQRSWVPGSVDNLSSTEDLVGQQAWEMLVKHRFTYASLQCFQNQNYYWDSPLKMHPEERWKNMHPGRDHRLSRSQYPAPLIHWGHTSRHDKRWSEQSFRCAVQTRVLSSSPSWAESSGL